MKARYWPCRSVNLCMRGSTKRRWIDLLVGKMVPGQRMRVRLGRVDRKFYDRRGNDCGAIPTNMVVVVMDRNAKEKPGFSRIYRPADLYLNGECTDGDGYYLEQNNLVPL